MATNDQGMKKTFSSIGSDDAFFGFFDQAQLAAGGFDVVAFFEAEGGGDAGFGEDVAEGLAVGNFRAFPRQALDGVVGDEVDLGLEGARVFGEDVGLGEVVVDTLDEDIFQREVLFFLRVPVLQGIEELGGGIFFIHRHDLIAHGIGGSVEGDGEADLAGMAGELADLRHEAGRGYC